MKARPVLVSMLLLLSGGGLIVSASMSHNRQQVHEDEACRETRRQALEVALRTAHGEYLEWTPVDAWGNRILVTVTDDEAVARSVGPDCRAWTSDDIVVRVPLEPAARPQRGRSLPPGIIG